MVEKAKIVVVGAGVSGMMAAASLAESDHEVFLFSRDHLGLSHSVLDCEGLNAVHASQDYPDSATQHFKDSFAYGGAIANQTLLYQMCQKSHQLIHLLQRIGVDWDLTVEGRLSKTLLAGSQFARTHLAKNNTGKQIVLGLTEQIRYFEAQQKICVYPCWEFLSLVLDDDKVCRGIVAQNRRSMEIYVFKADAVIFATGSWKGLYGKFATNSFYQTGSAITKAYKQGAHLANCEFVEFDSKTDQSNLSKTLGGIWIDDEHMSSIKGLLAAGKCEYEYHGAACLPGNSMITSLFAGYKASQTAKKYINDLDIGCEATAEQIFESELLKQRQQHMEYLDMSGPVNIYSIYDELVNTLNENLGPERYNSNIHQAQQKIYELKERFERVSIGDSGSWINQEVFFARDLDNMFDLALAVSQCALIRNESRGGHYKSEFPQRDDDNYLRTTKVKWTDDGPLISYEDIETKISDQLDQTG